MTYSELDQEPYNLDEQIEEAKKRNPDKCEII